MDFLFSLAANVEDRKSKKIRTAEGGLQMFTKLVCEKLETEKEMSNSDVFVFFLLLSRLRRSW